jgi:ribosomal-protein-alanine N-acetyltransferase
MDRTFSFDDITISPLEKSDIPTVLEIEYDSQPEPWNEKAFIEETSRANSILLVARLSTGASRELTGHHGGVHGLDRNPAIVAGYICFWLVGDEVQVLNLAVRRNLRRRGIARKLIDVAIRTGTDQRARFVTLEVRESNLAARKLYESFGFIVVGKRPGYYGFQKESAILMELEIEGFSV